MRIVHSEIFRSYNQVVPKFADSYLGQLRALVGHDLVLMPGAMLTLLRADGRALMTRRSDDGSWCLPAGAAEPGGSFATTAVHELREETGVLVDVADLVPFGSLSEASLHTINYPNGDITHAFALCFLSHRWTGDPKPDFSETIEISFVDPDAPPSPLHPPSAHALKLLRRYLATGQFQVS